MNNDNEFREPTAGEERETQYFCRLTFGQFFTLMVLEVVTVCFVFYLGARYGTEYLKIDTVKRDVSETVSPTDASEEGDVESPMASATDEELIGQARDKLKRSEQKALEEKVQDILSSRAAVPQPTETSETGEGEVGMQAASPKAPPSAMDEGGERTELDRALERLKAETSAEPSLPARSEAERLLEAARRPPHGAEIGGAVKVKSTAAAQYSLQVGAYSSLAEASAKVDFWKSRGYPAYMMIADLPGKGRWYRVRIGAFPTKDEANKYLADFSSRENVQAIVVLNEE